ncbi:glycosyltransferase [Rhodocyclaceae bacterium SMB388]
MIMPSYNTAPYIREAIESVLGQNYPSLELLVIDDGSTDDTPDIVRSYGERVRFFSQQNQGAGAARNLGLREARGDFIAFLDSDDIWLPGKLSAQVAYLTINPDIGVVYSRWRPWRPEQDGHFRMPTLPEQPNAPGFIASQSGWLYNRLLLGSILHTITVMMRRSVIDQIGPFDTQFKRGQDYDYWLRASRIAPIHKLDAVHALYRLHGEGCIKKWPKDNYEKIVLEKALNTWGNTGHDGEITPRSVIRRRIADICFDFGYHHYWEGDPRIALGSFADTIRRHPLKVKAWPYLFASMCKTLLSSLPAKDRPQKRS